MTDAQIEAICEGDDDIIFAPKDIPSSAVLSYPDGISFHYLPVEQKIESWLTEHNLKAEVVAAALLKQFVEAQTENK